MTPLAVIVSARDRLPVALSVAAAAAALGRDVAMLFDGGSVTALLDVDAALTTALELGVRVTACQTGLAEAGLVASLLPDGIETGGMVGFLRAHADAQWLLA